ncbi:MAG: 2-oxoacid:acceptor oxidoreductase family protein [Nitrospirae bacterium]|nr:2-oxoacid:acceptor oxidoreductase family protein [Nitrospirota bacterium]
MENRIIIAGSGGQGILFLGRLIAHAAMHEGREVTWFPSYGAEMRGGTANCTVIVSDEMIGSPVIRNPDVLMVLNEASYSRFADRLLTEGVLIYDSALISPTVSSSTTKRVNSIRVIDIPAKEIATAMSNTKAANMVMVGAMAAATGILSTDSAISALVEITPEHRKDSLEINKELIIKGFNYII